MLRVMRCGTLGLAVACLWGVPGAAQVEADPPVVRGVVVRGGEPLTDQRVALHRVSSDTAGEIATTLAAANGSFSFVLPRVPGGTDEVFFVSTRHQGILYFGGAVTDVAALDSLHTLEVFDTLGAPVSGYGFTISARNVFVEGIEEGWRITDVFELENGGDRTVVSSDAGVTWSYPLMAGATQVELGEGDLGPDVFSFAEGQVRTRAPVPPGSRHYVFRYEVPELAALQLPGITTRIEVLIREAAETFEVTGLRAEQPVELDPGSTFRRYVGDNITEATVTFVPVTEEERIPLAWMMVGLALALGLLGVWGVTRSRPATERRPRATVLLEIAQLDEEFAAIGTPSPDQRQDHQRRRDALLRGLADD